MVPMLSGDMVAFTASWGLSIPLALVALVFARDPRRRQALVEAAFGGLFTIVLVKLGGIVYEHPRPFVMHHVLPLVKHVADNSFPSDHAAAAGLAVAYLWPRSRLAALVAIAFGVLVGIARVAAQLHWPIDISFGYAFGVAGGLVANGCARYLRWRTDQRFSHVSTTR